MTGRWYRLKLTPDTNGTLTVTSPDLPEVTSFGDTEAEARRWGRDAIVEAIAGRLHFGEAVPPGAEAKPRGPAVELPLIVTLKLALHEALRAEGMTRAELARRMNVNRETVDRLFRLNHQSRVDQIDAAFRALGRPLSINLSPRAA